MLFNVFFFKIVGLFVVDALEIPWLKDCEAQAPSFPSHAIGAGRPPGKEQKVCNVQSRSAAGAGMGLLS